MKKLSKKLSMIIAMLLVAAIISTFGITAFAYSGAGTEEDPLKISTFKSGEELPPDSDPWYGNYYVNDTGSTFYFYTDYEWADIYVCQNNVAPFPEAYENDSDGPAIAPGATFDWAKYTNAWEQPAKIVFYCATHTLEKVSAQEPTCEKDGIKEHYKCSLCGNLFADEQGTIALTEEDIIDPASHKLKAVEAKAPTCTEDGVIAHFACERCGALFADELGLVELAKEDIVDPATGHKLVAVEAVAPTATADGVKAHYKCEKCGKLFADKDATKELSAKDIIDPATGTSSQEVKPASSSSVPKTADAGMPIVFIVLAVVALAAVIVLKNKKHSA